VLQQLKYEGELDEIHRNKQGMTGMNGALEGTY
jgi:hypothetical protein